MRSFPHILKIATCVLLGLSLITSSMVVGIQHDHQTHGQGDQQLTGHSHGQHASHSDAHHGHHHHLHFAGHSIAGDHHDDQIDYSDPTFKTSGTSISANQSFHWSLVTFQISAPLPGMASVHDLSLHAQRHRAWLPILLGIERAAPPVPPPQVV